MIRFFSNDTKVIIEEFSSNDYRYRFNLYLISCYFDPKSAFDLIKYTLEYNNIKNIYVFIDRNEAFNIGYENLKKFLKSVRQSIAMRGLSATISLHAIKGNPGIFHSKIYSLINFDNENNIRSGKLIVGSANLTPKGLMAESGNIETVYTSNKISVLKKFIQSLPNIENRKIELDNIYKFQISTDEDIFDWQYAFLKSGYFVHKWSDSLSSDLSAKFYLTDLGRRYIQNEELKQKGFTNDTKTISKNYFDQRNLVNYPAYLGGDKDFIKKNGLEVYLGHWIPKGALRIVDNEAFGNFKQCLISQMEEQKDSIVSRLNEDIQWLKLNKFVDDKYETRYFSDKYIRAIEENDLKIMRIYTRYEIFEMPYDISQEEQIVELYDMILATKESKRHKYAIARIDQAIKTSDLTHLVDSEKYYNS